MALASTRAVARASRSANISSWASTNSSAPIDRGFFITSIANSAPTESTVIVPPVFSLIWSAASTAFSSKPLTTGEMPGASRTLLVSGSIWKADGGISGSITCLTQTMMSTGKGGLPVG